MNVGRCEGERERGGRRKEGGGAERGEGRGRGDKRMAHGDDNEILPRPTITIPCLNLLNSTCSSFKSFPSTQTRFSHTNVYTLLLLSHLSSTSHSCLSSLIQVLPIPARAPTEPEPTRLTRSISIPALEYQCLVDSPSVVTVVLLSYHIDTH